MEVDSVEREDLAVEDSVEEREDLEEAVMEEAWEDLVEEKEDLEEEAMGAV